MAIVLGDFSGNGTSPAPVLDFGLRRLNTNANRVVLCSAQPVTYAQVGTFLLGAATPATVFALPSNYMPSGRQALLTAITNGIVTVGGTASFIAVVDDTNADLLMTASLNVPQVVQIGYVWQLGSFGVAITNAQILLFNPVNLVVSSPMLGIPTLSLPSLGIHLSANGRYLVTASGAPLLLFADSAQGMSRLPPDQVTTYINTRASQGFNAIQFDLVSDPYVGNNNTSPFAFATDTDAANPTAFAPFVANVSGVPDITQPDINNYWPRMDSYVQQLASANMVAILNPIEPTTNTGASTQGFNSLSQALTTNGAAAIVNFGQFVGARYASYGNVIWLLGNDYSDTTTTTHSIMTNLIAGVLAGDPNHVMTLQLIVGGTSPTLSTQVPSSSYSNLSGQGSNSVTPALNMNGYYTYGSVYGEGTLAYLAPSQTFAGSAGQNRTTPAPAPVPTILLRSNYTNENIWSGGNDGGGTLRSNIRRQNYWSIMAGGTGQIYGAHLVYNFGGGSGQGGFAAAQAEFTTDPTVGDLQTWYNFFTAMQWWTLTPDIAHTVGTAGFGTPGINNVMSTDGYITVLGSPALAVAYFGNYTVNGSLTVNLATFTAGTPVTGQWFDPTNGVYLGTTGSPYANSGTHVFTPPAANHLGDPDWVLLLSVPTAAPVAIAASFPLTVPASTGEVIGTMTATKGVNAPTSWSIVGVGGPGSPSTTWFAIDTTPSDSTFGQLTVTSTGAANLTGSTNGNVYTVQVQATNRVGSTMAQATLTAQGLTATAVLVGGQVGPGISINFASSADAGDLIGAVTVTTNAPGTYIGTINIGGTDGAKFSLSPVTNILSASFPCSLYVGQANVTAGGGSGAGGVYVITLTASP